MAFSRISIEVVIINSKSFFGSIFTHTSSPSSVTTTYISPPGLVGSPSLIQGHWENSDAHSQYYHRLLHVISHHICHLTLELSAGFFREMEKMADTGHQMLQQRIKDATNFQ
ncbi:hypothetical protein MKX03_014852 [Papaver bracteatum]|nr:hypothetical protein MKX03_014852 [Papaver bracteatum]